jgi:hypothetical protein
MLVFNQQALLFQVAHLTVDAVCFVLKLAVAGAVGSDPPVVKVLYMSDETVEMGAGALEHRSEPSQ